MTLTAAELPYSIEDAAAYPYSGGTPGAIVDVVGIFKLDSKSAVSTAEHRGDNQVLATSATYDKVDITVTLHQIHFASLAALCGGVSSASGTTPNQINKYERKTTDAAVDFKLVGQTHGKDATGGGFRATWPRCQWQGGPDYNFDDNAFPEVTVTCSAIANASNILFDLEQYETYTALA